MSLTTLVMVVAVAVAALVAGMFLYAASVVSHAMNDDEGSGRSDEET